MKLNHSPVHRQRSTPQQRAQLLQAFGHSQLTTAQFAAQHGIGTSTLYAWRRRAPTPRRRPANATPTPHVFQQVSLTDVLGAGRHWVGEIQLPDGTQLRWSQQTSTTALQDLLTHLRRSC